MSNQDIIKKLIGAQKCRAQALKHQAQTNVLVNKKMDKQIITENINNRKALAGNLRKVYGGNVNKNVGYQRNKVFKTGSRPSASFAPPVFNMNQPLENMNMNVRGSGIRRAENAYIDAWKRRNQFIDY